MDIFVRHGLILIPPLAGERTGRPLPTEEKSCRSSMAKPARQTKELSTNPAGMVDLLNFRRVFLFFLDAFIENLCQSKRDYSQRQSTKDGPDPIRRS